MPVSCSGFPHPSPPFSPHDKSIVETWAFSFHSLPIPTRSFIPSISHFISRSRSFFFSLEFLVWLVQLAAQLVPLAGSFLGKTALLTVLPLFTRHPLSPFFLPSFLFVRQGFFLRISFLSGKRFPLWYSLGCDVLNAFETFAPLIGPPPASSESFAQQGLRFFFF